MKEKIYLHFECEVFFEVLDDHHEKREFDAEGFLWVGWTCDVGGGDV
jgi:negative regulator of genetic competence, sporulation and motility